MVTVVLYEQRTTVRSSGGRHAPLRCTIRYSASLGVNGSEQRTGTGGRRDKEGEGLGGSVSVRALLAPRNPTSI